MASELERALLDDVVQRAARGERIKAVYFWGHTERPGAVTAACLSQWYPAAFEVDGQRYAHAEQFMMAEKARLFGDEAARQAILQTDKAGAVKALGRGVRGFDEALWEAERLGIVLRAAAWPSSARTRRWAPFCWARASGCSSRPAPWTASGASAWPQTTSVRRTRAAGAGSTCWASR